MSVLAVLAALSISATDVAREAACFRDETQNGIKFQVYLGDRVCVRFDPPRVIQGVWINNFEGSGFMEGAHSLNDANRSTDSVWLTIDEKSETPPELPRAPNYRAYRIRFVGRTAHDMHRQPCRDGYGHLGCWAGLVLVDHVITAVDLGPTLKSR